MDPSNKALRGTPPNREIQTPQPLSELHGTVLDTAADASGAALNLLSEALGELPDSSLGSGRPYYPPTTVAGNPSTSSWNEQNASEGQQASDRAPQEGLQSYNASGRDEFDGNKDFDNIFDPEGGNDPDSFLLYPLESLPWNDEPNDRSLPHASESTRWQTQNDETSDMHHNQVPQAHGQFQSVPQNSSRNLSWQQVGMQSYNHKFPSVSVADHGQDPQFSDPQTQYQPPPQPSQPSQTHVSDSHANRRCEYQPYLNTPYPNQGHQNQSCDNQNPDFSNIPTTSQNAPDLKFRLNFITSQGPANAMNYNIDQSRFLEGPTGYEHSSAHHLPQPGDEQPRSISSNASYRTNNPRNTRGLIAEQEQMRPIAGPSDNQSNGPSLQLFNYDDSMTIGEARDVIFPKKYPIGRRVADDDFPSHADSEDKWMKNFLTAIDRRYTGSTEETVKETEFLIRQQDDLGSAIGNDKEKVFTNRAVNARVRFLWLSIVALHSDAPAPYPIGCDGSGFGFAKLKFSDRVMQVEKFLGKNKRVCRDVIEGRSVLGFVKNPEGYHRRKLTNNKSNENKKEINAAAKARLTATVDTGESASGPPAAEFSGASSRPRIPAEPRATSSVSDGIGRGKRRATDDFGEDNMRAQKRRRTGSP